MKNGIRALSLILNQDFTSSPCTNEYNKAREVWFNVLPVCLTKQTQLPYWSGKQNKLTHQCHLCSEEKSQHLCFLLLSLGAVDRLLPLMFYRCSRHRLFTVMFAIGTERQDGSELFLQLFVNRPAPNTAIRTSIFHAGSTGVVLPFHCRVASQSNASEHFPF